MNARAETAIDVLFVLQPRALLLDLAGPSEAFRLANRHRRKEHFRLRYVGPASEMESSVGACLSKLEPLPEVFERPTWIVIVGFPSSQLRERSVAWDRIVGWLARRVRPLLDAGGGNKLVTVCAGGVMAADAGLMASRRWTTHHDLIPGLRRSAAGAQVVGDRIFVEDGPVCSSAGVTAGIDLALHLIAGELGEAVAVAVARDMVVYHRRGPDDPQLSPYFAFRNHLHAVVHRVQDAVSADPGRDWNAESLARAGRVTPRHLNRLFLRHAGVSPLAYLRRIRLERAQRALAAGATVTGAAEAAGFSSDVALRRAWKLIGGTPKFARAVNEGSHR